MLSPRLDIVKPPKVWWFKYTAATILLTIFKQVHQRNERFLQQPALDSLVTFTNESANCTTWFVHFSQNVGWKICHKMIYYTNPAAALMLYCTLVGGKVNIWNDNKVGLNCKWRTLLLVLSFVILHKNAPFEMLVVTYAIFKQLLAAFSIFWKRRIIRMTSNPLSALFERCSNSSVNALNLTIVQLYKLAFAEHQKPLQKVLKVV